MSVVPFSLTNAGIQWWFSNSVGRIPPRLWPVRVLAFRLVVLKGFASSREAYWQISRGPHVKSYWLNIKSPPKQYIVADKFRSVKSTLYSSTVKFSFAMGHSAGLRAGTRVSD